MAARIAWHLAEARRLQEQQRHELVVTIATVIGIGVTFSAGELWRHRVVTSELQTAFDDAGLTNARQLGKKLRQLGFERVYRDGPGHVWLVSASALTEGR